jgi:outer membrane receptor protein involved in Fe transport
VKSSNWTCSLALSASVSLLVLALLTPLTPALGQTVEGSGAYDWDALDEGESEEAYDWDALDEGEGAASDSTDSDDAYDWDALDEGEGTASDATDSDDAYDWDALDEGEEEADWDSYWDELDAQEEVIEEVVVPEVVAEDSGGVRGQVIDDQSGTPFPRATVVIVGTGLESLSDAEGRFFFELEPGTYTVRVSHFELSTAAFEVLIEPGEITDLAEVRMVPSDNQTTIVVEGRAVRESTAEQLRERQEAATVQDAIGAEQIARAGDSSAGGAVRRVVGVTLLEDRFLVVRGLGGRYNQVTLNGAPVPRTDPDYPAAEVDMFPTELLSNLTLAKSPTVSLPSFVGGLMNVETRSYPEEFLLKLSASVGGSNTATFQDFLSVPGGRLDGLGFDDGTRALPSSLPTDETLDRRRTEDYEAIARAFPDEWDPETRIARPNMGLKLSLGDTVEVGSRRLGYLLVAGYDNGFSHRMATRRTARVSDAGVEAVESLDGHIYDEKVAWGTLGTISLELARGHELRLVSLWNHTARDRFVIWEGVSEEENGDLERTSREWLQRSLVFNQLIGSHRRLLPEASPLHETRIDWSAALSVANRDEPDNRSHKTVDDMWVQNPGTGEHFMSALDQTDTFARLALTLPYLDAFETTVGGDVQRVHRDFDTRRFRYQLGTGADPTLRTLGPEEAFADENVTAEGDGVVLREWTGPGDGYVADQLGASAFGQVDVRPTAWLRLVAGLRYEAFEQELRDDTIGQDGPGEVARRVDQDLLPSGGAIFELRDGMFIRALYAASVARPQSREIAPFVYQDYVRRRTVTGSPDLVRTYVHNADLRWEWFLSAEEVVAATIFYKQFLHPIESTLVNRQGDVIYVNADSSTNFGAELEAQLDLGRYAPRAEGLTVGANVALTHSQIELPCPDDNGDGECDYAYTNQTRPMEGQARVQVNARVGWDAPNNGFSANLTYALLGERVSDVGTNGVPDAYLLPEHRLDLTLGYEVNEHWSLGFKARNITAGTVREQVGDVLVYEERVPTEFSLSAGWRY